MCVDIDGALWAISHRSIRSDQSRVMLRGKRSDRLNELPGLLVGVEPFNGNKNVQSGRAGSF